LFVKAIMKYHHWCHLGWFRRNGVGYSYCK